MRILAAFSIALALVAQPASAGEMAHDKMPGEVTKAPIEITGAWVRTALPRRPSAGYLSIANTGDAVDRLLSVSSDAFDAVEIHRSSMKDGVMRMTPVDGVEIPGGGEVALEQGGLHLMMFGAKGLKEGETVTLTLTFETAGKVTLTAPVLKRAGQRHNH